MHLWVAEGCIIKMFWKRLMLKCHVEMVQIFSPRLTHNETLNEKQNLFLMKQIKDKCWGRNYMCSIYIHWLWAYAEYNYENSLQSIDFVAL